MPDSKWRFELFQSFIVPYAKALTPFIRSCCEVETVAAELELTPDDDGVTTLWEDERQGKMIVISGGPAALFWRIPTYFMDFYDPASLRKSVKHAASTMTGFMCNMLRRGGEGLPLDTPQKRFRYERNRHSPEDFLSEIGLVASTAARELLNRLSADELGEVLALRIHPCLATGGDSTLVVRWDGRITPLEAALGIRGRAKAGIAGAVPVTNEEML